MGVTKRQRPILVHTEQPFSDDSVGPIKEQLGLGAPDDGSGDGNGDSVSSARDYFARSQLPAPGEDWLNKTVIVLPTRRTYLCQNEPFLADQTTSTWESLESYYTSGDADLTIFHRAFPQADSGNVGSYFYDTYNNTFYRVVETSTGEYDFRHVGAAEALREVCHAFFAANEGGELPGGDDTRVIYLGEAHDDDDATDILLTHGTFDITAEYGVFLNFISNQFEIVTQYTPAGSLIDHYVWNDARAEAVNRILRPGPGNIFPTPDEALFQSGIPLIDRFGHGWGVQSVLHPGEEERAVFARLRSSPSDSASTRGTEAPPAWASGTEYGIGDRVESNTVLYVCIQAHTSTTTGATGDPDDENFGFTNYWDDTQSLIQVPNRSRFRGVYGRGRRPGSQSVGDWLAEAHGNTVAFLRYATMGGPLFGSSGWFTYHPYSRVLGAFQTEEEATRAIHSFDENVRTIALINGQLRELTYFVDHTADTHTYEWVPSRPAGNPVAVFYGAAMTAAGGRWQEADAGNGESEGNDRLLRWHETARESFFHGNALSFEFHAPDDVSGEDATITNEDVLFSPEPGIYHFEMGAASSGAANQDDGYLGLYQVMSGTADDLARALVSIGRTTNTSLFGEPDTSYVAKVEARFLQVNEGDVFLGLMGGLAGNVSQYMVWEKID